MKNNAWKIGILMAISLLVLLSATSAFGQTSARFTIPFRFLAGDQMMPAGQYLVRVDPLTRTLNLQHESFIPLMTLRVIPGKRSSDPLEENRLLFKAYGNARVPLSGVDARLHGCERLAGLQGRARASQNRTRRLDCRDCVRAC